MAEDLKSTIIKLALEGDLEQSVKLAGNDVTLLYDVGTYFHKRGQLEIALIFIEKILEIDSKNIGAHNYLGVLLSDLKRYEEAEREYKEALRLEPKQAETHANLGNLLKELKRYEEAEREHREAIRLKPGLAEAHNNLGTLLSEMRRYEEAEKEYREAVRLKPSVAEARNNLGNLLSDFKRYEEAEREYREAIRLKPGLVEAHNNLGALLSGLKRYEEAEREYREALRLKPDYAEAHANLGIMLIDRGDFTSDDVFYEEAIDEFRKALDLGLEDTEVHNNLGYTYVKLGDPNKAREEFRKALRLDPSYYKARRNLKRIDKTKREKVPTGLKVILGLIVVGELGFSYYIFLNTDKLSGSNFVTMTMILTAFLLFLVVYPELRKFEAGPFKFEMDGKGKTTKTPSEIEPSGMER